jgi:hypothetical protein
MFYSSRMRQKIGMGSVAELARKLLAVGVTGLWW